MISYFAVNRDALARGDYYKITRGFNGNIRNISRFILGEFHCYVPEVPNDLYHFSAQAAAKVLSPHQLARAN